MPWRWSGRLIEPSEHTDIGLSGRIDRC